MRALVVDDSSAMRKILGRLLRALGFEVLEAEHGQAALETLEALEPAARPRVALVDWHMPVMDGLEFVGQVRARPPLAGVRLMMVTTEMEQGQVARALAAGAEEYVVKPFTPELIVEKLGRLGVLFR